MTKKIILLLVEGPSDEDSLAFLYSKIVAEHNIYFDVLHTDITADEEMTVKYIETRIKVEIKKYLDRNPFIKRSDIIKIVQIIDTDGAFIPSSQVKASATGITQYFDTHIEAKNQQRLIRRNISKRAIVYHLINSAEIAGFPYEIYYFSRNLEHVLHNLPQELTDEEKENLAFDFADHYSQHPEKFLDYLYDDSFHVKGDYRETWNFIFKNGNSLKRYSNMSLFFEQLGLTPATMEPLS